LSFNGNMETRPGFSGKEREIAAFRKASKLYEDYVESSEADPSANVPPKLINIRTGGIEPGGMGKRYVIASYICYPERIAKDPFDSSYEVKSWKWRVGATESFLLKADQVSEALPQFMSRIDSGEEGVDQIAYPSELSPMLSEDYQREVYLLTAREANRRCLNYVWVDCLCVDQTDPDDIERNVHKMADFYRGAECCLAVGEVLRRRMWIDATNARNPPEWLPSDHLLFWIVGFHRLRTWLFQETFLAKEVIGRAGDLRIDITAFLADCEKHVHDRGDAGSLSKGDKVDKRHFFKAVCELPTSTTHAEDGYVLSLHRCLQLLNGRTPTLPQDRVYGALGLFPRIIRQAMPIDYNLSLSAVYAMLNYLRIRYGDLNAILALHSKRFPRHGILSAPTWMPSGYGEALWDNNALPMDITLPPQAILVGTRPGDILILRASSLPVSSISYIGQDNFTTGSANRLVTLVHFGQPATQHVYRCWIEPIDYDDEDHFPRDGSTSEARQRLVDIRSAATNRHAVIALLGRQNSNNITEDLPWVWVLLCTGDEGGTWMRRGVVLTDQQAAFARNEERDFQIV
jgi:hypothetical protein